MDVLAVISRPKFCALPRSGPKWDKLGYVSVNTVHQHIRSRSLLPRSPRR